MTPKPNQLLTRNSADPGTAEPTRSRLVSWRFRRGSGAAMGLSKEQQGHVAQVNQRIASGEYRIEHDNCCCGAFGGDVIAQVDRYGIALDTILCSACATLRFDPYLSADCLADFYRTQYQEMYARVPDADAYFARQQGYGHRLLRFATKQLVTGAVVAEVGCGAGGALAVFRDAGFTVFGCDYSRRLIEHGVQAGVGSLCLGAIDELAHSMQHAGRRADLIFLHHVFEHLGAPQDWLERATSLLAEGGLIAIAVPDVAEIERFASPDGDLRLFLHIAHKYNFTFQGLVALGAKAGFHASRIDVEPSTQAPELWVAFTRHELRSGLAPEPAWQGTSKALLQRLRSTERRFLWRAVERKLAKWMRRGGQALAKCLPRRRNPS